MAQKKIDEIGNRYGKLTVLKETRDKNHSQPSKGV